MVAETILCNRSDANTVILEARDEWIIEVLMELAVPEEVIESGFEDKSADSREEYIIGMNDLGISVDLFSNGEVNVYKRVWFTDEYGNEGWLPISDKQIVAQWKKPERILKADGRDIYYEIHLDQWSIKNMRA